MKILLVHNFYKFWGGEDTYFESLARLLKEHGHTVIIYSKKNKDIKTILDKVKFALGMFWNFQTQRELSLLIKKSKPDVAHFHNLYPMISPTAYWVCKKNKISMVQHIHNYRFMCPKGNLYREGKVCELCVKSNLKLWSIFYSCYHESKISSLIFALSFYLHKIIGTFNLVSKYIFPSKFTQKYYEKYLKLERSKSMYLPFFTDLPKKSRIHKRQNWYLYVGRLSEEKGISQLLEIFKNLPKKKIKVIGNGPLKRSFDKYIKYKNIKIFGNIDRIKLIPYYQSAKALIIPSLWYEVFPFTLLEAYMFNVPIILNRKFKERWENESATADAKYISLNDVKLPSVRQSKKKSDYSEFSYQKHLRKLVNIYEK